MDCFNRFDSLVRDMFCDGFAGGYQIVILGFVGYFYFVGLYYFFVVLVWLVVIVL